MNFDHPNAIDWPLFRRCVAASRRGGSPEIPAYDFATHTRQAATRVWQPRPLVLLDGLWLLRYAALRRLYAWSVYIDCPEATRLQRRLLRDQRERGRAARSIRAQFEREVAPLHRRFVAGQARWADCRLESPPSAGRLRELRARCRQFLSGEKS